MNLRDQGELNFLDGGMMNKLFLMFLILLISMGSVSALGITPARTTVDFDQGLEFDKSFTILNSESKNLNIVVYTQGNLAGNIYLSENSFSMSSSESSKQLNYKLKIPANLPPGRNEGEIIIMALPEGQGTSEAFVGAALAVVHQVHVNVKYPGKYAEADLNIIDANQGDDVVLVVPVFSRGEHDLVSVRANVDIYNQLNEKVDSFNTVSISINSGERKELVHKWKADVSIGRYLAKVALIYDGETINLEKQFRVGMQELELQNIEVRNFRLGDIARFEMLIENKWSEPIKNAFTEMHIFDSQDRLISEVKSASYDFEPLSKEVLVSFWDTAGIREGDYETKFFLKYGDKSSQKNLELKVSKDSIRVIGLGYVISSEEGRRGDSNLVFILVVGIVVLILINLLWFIILRKKFKK
jgi:hypothetical protein